MPTARTHRLVLASSLIALITLPGCAGLPASSTASDRTPASPIPSTADPEGRISGYQYARRHEDVVRVDGRNQHQIVEYGFDYDRAQTLRRIYSPQGELIEEQQVGPVSLRANPTEEARLIELVKTHPQLGPMMQESGLLVHSGGFVYREPDDPYCSRGSRCLRFIVTRGDGSVPHIHAVVDLVSDRVVHPFYGDNAAGLAARKESKQ